MTITSTLAFAAAFFLLALSPGPGLVAILSRTLGAGFRSGLMVTMGLVIGDAIFLGIAMIGLSKIATTMGPLFQVVKYIGAGYLIWLGIQACRAASVEHPIESTSSKGPWQDVGLGLMVTLGNPKPILFYGALLPTFLDLSKIGLADFGILMSIVLSVSVIVYSGYMLLADRARRFLSSKRAIKRLNQTTGVMLIGSGLAVASRS
jgi:threonine/homoserine/homoserine lactone efflux protein